MSTKFKQVKTLIFNRRSNIIIRQTEKPKFERETSL